MIVLPSLELRNGACVHPANGSPAGRQPEIGDPITVARTWANTGFRCLHVTDIDAEYGSGSNTRVVEELIRDGALEIQAGGGLHSTDLVERLMDAGASRLIVGARALDEPEWLANLAELFPGSVVVATDVRDRRVTPRSRPRRLPVDVMDLADELSTLPLGGLLVGSAQSDAPRSALDLALLEDLAEQCDYPLMAAGGVADLNDLRALENRGVSAVILGHALYSGAVDPRAVALEFGE